MLWASDRHTGKYAWSIDEGDRCILTTKQPLALAMKILEQTPSTLVIGRSWRQHIVSSTLPLAFFTVFLGAFPIGLVSSIWNAGSVKLACRRLEPTQVNCELSRSYLFGQLNRPAQTIKWVQNARLDSETKTDSEGDETTTYWVTLETQSGDRPIDLLNPRKGISGITPLFQGDQTEILVQQSNYVTSGLGLLVGLAGTSVFIFIVKVGLWDLHPQLIFDRESQCLTCKGEGKPRQISLKDICAIELQPRIYFDEAPATETSVPYRLGLSLTGNQYIELLGTFKHFKYSYPDPVDAYNATIFALAKTLGEFLSVPVQTVSDRPQQQTFLDYGTLFDPARDCLMSAITIWHKALHVIPRQDLQSVYLTQFPLELSENKGNVDMKFGYRCTLQFKSGKTQQLRKTKVTPNDAQARLCNQQLQDQANDLLEQLSQLLNVPKSSVVFLDEPENRSVV